VASILIKNCKALVQVRSLSQGIVRGDSLSELPTISNAYVYTEGETIRSFGPMDEIPTLNADVVIDASGRFVLPAFVDCHTHLVFAATREEEFVMKIRGASYSEIAAKGGGILNSARKVQHASEDELFDTTLARVNELISTGTGAVEIKSGYGLTTTDELKMLRVARRIGNETLLTVKTTFLGAHAVPGGFTREAYVDHIINEMIPAVAASNLADYIDVFCEQGFFSKEDTIRIGQAGINFGLKPRLHANQLSRSGGVQAGVALKAISVDHLENIGPEEIALLAGSSVIPTVLPGAAFFLNLPMPPARDMINAGLPIAIASDYNPGSSPSGNMPLMISLACIRMRMTPEEAINAATMNAACALQIQSQVGSITVGKLANMVITKPMPSLAYLPYSYGSQLIEKVVIRGKIVR
jgi:imidazolonepropionase